jgi:His Kinase A (phospho-acceptor) domain
MSDSLPSPAQEAAKPSLHPALYGTEDLPGSVPTILVCPLPLPGFPHERLLPELSHELKTPLTGIMGLAQVLQHDPAPMADRGHQYADLIYQRSQQLLVSINDLFDLAQLCTHQFVLHLRPIDLASVVKTALKVAQNTTPSNLPRLEALHSPPESTLWIMGDLRRVEQLLTHLIGYFAAQGLPESRPIVTLRSHHSWLSITLLGKLQLESALEQGHSGTHPSWEACVSNMPGRSGTVLKFFLAKQLAQLHGGDVSWRVRASFDTEVTVLLPRDLTRATFFNWPGAPQPLFLIYAPQLPHEDDLAQALDDRDALAVVARSLYEVQEKTRILSPSVLVLESDCVKTPEWPAIEALLAESSTFKLIQVVWLKTGPIPEENDRINTLGVWSVPLIPDQIAQTLKHLQQSAQRAPSKASETAVATLPSPPARPLIVLQIAQIS